MINIESFNLKFESGESKHVISRDSSFSIDKGEMVGVYGPSGVGKSMLGLSLIGMVPDEAKLSIEGQYNFEDHHYDLSDWQRVDWTAIRRRHIGYVFQQAPAYFNPVRRCGSQLMEVLKESGLTDYEKKERCIDVLGEVSLANPDRIMKAYPHELSVGQLQRLMLATAVVRNPDLIIADEPFASVDVVTRNELMDLVIQLNRNKGIAFLIISHDLGTLNRLTTRRLTYKDKQLVELSTEALALKFETEIGGIGNAEKLTVRGVSKSFRVSRKYAFKKANLAVLKDINLTVKEGEVIGILGRSGCGKSTLARLVAGIDGPDQGTINISGNPVKVLRMNGFRDRIRQPAQMVFQDPYAAFDPHWTIDAHFREAARHSPVLGDRNNWLMGMMHDLDLDALLLKRKPAQLSGGQLQRCCLIMTLITTPEMLICDESFSALDPITKSLCLSAIINYADSEQIGVMIISHDLEVLKLTCHRLYGMRDGALREVQSDMVLTKKSSEWGTNEVLKQFI